MLCVSQKLVHKNHKTKLFKTFQIALRSGNPPFQKVVQQSIGTKHFQSFKNFVDQQGQQDNRQFSLLPFFYHLSLLQNQKPIERWNH